MSFPVLQQYLARLSDGTGGASSIWLDADGKAQGRFFNCTMSSAFQPIRRLDHGQVQAYEGLARSVSSADQGLSLWKLLDHAASDDESVELDRLCRMLHAINFFRQTEADAGPDAPDLFLNVHDRLLSAVSSNHGHAFRRILDALELPLNRIVLQLPPVTPQQGWLLNYVADNYRRNGFRFAVHAAHAREALQVLERVRPDVFKLDARSPGDRDSVLELLRRAAASGAGVVFKRLETQAAVDVVRELGEAAGAPALGQGFWLDTPRASLVLPEHQRQAVAA
jgi:EAL domain-containing protein (putative c-di-GMP-specific phosphodiesterase class I)